MHWGPITLSAGLDLMYKNNVYLPTRDAVLIIKKVKNVNRDNIHLVKQNYF